MDQAPLGHCVKNDGIVSNVISTYYAGPRIFFFRKKNQCPKGV